MFDPTGFLAPVLLRGKILLRKTWEVPNNELGWDDCLPPELMREMIDFLIELHELEDIEFPGASGLMKKLVVIPGWWYSAMGVNLGLEP